MQTALRIKNQNIIFFTIPHETETLVEISYADEEFKPIGEPERQINPMKEEEYHRGLRKDANLMGQFVPKYSTNPELNPVKPKENETN